MEDRLKNRYQAKNLEIRLLSRKTGSLPGSQAPFPEDRLLSRSLRSGSHPLRRDELSSSSISASDGAGNRIVPFIGTSLSCSKFKSYRTNLSMKSHGFSTQVFLLSFSPRPMSFCLKMFRLDWHGGGEDITQVICAEGPRDQNKDTGGMHG